jgi:hypothetical protein
MEQNAKSHGYVKVDRGQGVYNTASVARLRRDALQFRAGKKKLQKSVRWARGQSSSLNLHNTEESDKLFSAVCLLYIVDVGGGWWVSIIVYNPNAFFILSILFLSGNKSLMRRDIIRFVS